jgi:hypothetical protein
MGENLVPWSHYEKAYQAIYEANLPPNRAVKFEVDLSTDRSDKSLVEAGLLPGAETFLYLTLLRKGDGVWSFKMKFDDGSTITYSQGELADGYLMERRFVDLLFSNSSQTGKTNPKFMVEWKE